MGLVTFIYFFKLRLFRGLDEEEYCLTVHDLV